jgi:hypothetical protein
MTQLDFSERRLKLCMAYLLRCWCLATWQKGQAPISLFNYNLMLAARNADYDDDEDKATR